MNMIDHGRMATPPAALRRLRIASGVLLALSAISAAGIDVIGSMSIYAVAPVPFVMLAAIVTATLYWYRKSRLEREYWTPEREAEHVAAAVRRTSDKREVGAAAKPRRWWLPR